MQALAVGQERSLAYLERFADHVDGLLLKHYQYRSQRALGPLLQQLQEAVGDDEDCRTGAIARIEAATCRGQGTCEAAPRLVLVGGAMVATTVELGPGDTSCTELHRERIPEAIAKAQIQAARSTVDGLDPGWMLLAHRVGALSSVFDVLVDVCTPRRRRFAEEDLERLRDELDAVMLTLSEDASTGTDGSWSFEPAPLDVPGIGSMWRVAAFDSGSGGAAARAIGQARAMRELVQRRAQCAAGPGEIPLAVVVADARSGRPIHLGLHYPEELSCESLGPLSAVGERPPATVPPLLRPSAVDSRRQTK
jgi:hypothetical protein